MFLIYSEIEKKITDHNYNKYITCKSDIANIVNKRDFDNKLLTFHKRINLNKLKHVLIKNESKKFQTFDSSLFIDQSDFNNDRDQLYLIFQPICKIITQFSGLPGTIWEWGSNRLSNEKFKPPYTANKSLHNRYGWIILE